MTLSLILSMLLIFFNSVRLCLLQFLPGQKLHSGLVHGRSQDMIPLTELFITQQQVTFITMLMAVEQDHPYWWRP